MESLALADATDESLAGKTHEYRTHNYIVNLRVACIKILSTAMGFEDFMSGQGNPTRSKIVTVFFKCSVRSLSRQSKRPTLLSRRSSRKPASFPKISCNPACARSLLACKTRRDSLFTA